MLKLDRPLLSFVFLCHQSPLQSKEYVPPPAQDLIPSLVTNILHCHDQTFRTQGTSASLLLTPFLLPAYPLPLPSPVPVCGIHPSLGALTCLPLSNLDTNVN
jgi:hypothetical protein